MPDLEKLSFACQPADDAPVGRETLVLPDGCRTLVLRHRRTLSSGPAPEQPGPPPVLYVHGIQSHPGWFIRSAQALARAGSEVFQVTRRGSGPVTAGRGDAASAAQLMDDVDAAVRYVLEKTRTDRVALLGVSWGGKLLTAYALEAPDIDRIDSLTLVAPGIAPLVDVPARTKLAILAARCFHPGMYFDIPLNDVSLFTDNPAMRQYLRDDPHRLHRATARFLFTSAMLDRKINRANERALTVPTTLILAGRDRIIDNETTCDVLEWLADRPVSIRRLDAAHTIEFEPDPEPFHKILRQAVNNVA